MSAEDSIQSRSLGAQISAADLWNCCHVFIKCISWLEKFCSLFTACCYLFTLWDVLTFNIIWSSVCLFAVWKFFLCRWISVWPRLCVCLFGVHQAEENWVRSSAWIWESSAGFNHQRSFTMTHRVMRCCWHLYTPQTAGTAGIQQVQQVCYWCLYCTVRCTSPAQRWDVLRMSVRVQSDLDCSPSGVCDLRTGGGKKKKTLPG